MKFPYKFYSLLFTLLASSTLIIAGQKSPGLVMEEDVAALAKLIARVGDEIDERIFIDTASLLAKPRESLNGVGGQRFTLITPFVYRTFSSNIKFSCDVD